MMSQTPSTHAQETLLCTKEKLILVLSMHGR